MPLGTEVGLGPGDIVLDGELAPLHRKGHSSPHFSAHVYYGQTDGWIRMPLCMKEGLSPGDIVLDGGPNSHPFWGGPEFGGVNRRFQA